MTTAGSVLGTPAYMAPEQERGEAVDQRADVFAIGAMLWELCSLHKVPPANRQQRHRLLRSSGIDHDLIVIIDKALDRDPHGRYRDAGPLAADLKAFKSGARITARDYSLVAMLAHWMRRHRALATSTVAFLGLLVVSIVALAVLYRSSSDNAETAHTNEIAARRNAKTAEERLVQSYLEQGRHALLDGKHAEALVYLTEVIHRGGDAPDVRFMLERAAQPLARETLRLRSPTPRMFTAKFSCDGSQILTSDDKGAQISDAKTGQLLFDLPHHDIVLKAQYAPGCKIVVAFGRGGVIKIWNAETGRLVRTLMPTTAGDLPQFNGGVISSSGRMIAAADRSGGSVYVWDAHTGAELAQLANAADPGVRLAFSHDDEWLATHIGMAVRLFDTRTWKPRAITFTSTVTSLALDPTSDRVVVGTTAGEVALRGIPDGRRIRRLREMGDSTRRVTFSPDGQLIAATSHDGTALVWDASSGAIKVRLASPHQYLGQVEFNQSSTLVASASEGSVLIANVSTGMTSSMLAIGRYLSELHFDPSSQRLIGSSLDGTTRVWNISSSYRQWGSPELGKDCGTDVNVEPDRRFVAVGCGEHMTQIWDTSSDRLVATLPSMGNEGSLSVRPVVSSTGELAAIVHGRALDLYELPSGRLIGTIHHVAQITAVRFANEGRALVAGGKDGVLLVARDGEAEPRRVSMGSSAVDVAALLPDGRVLAVDADRHMAVFDVDTQVRVVDMVSPSRVEALRVSHDGLSVIAIPQKYLSMPPTLWMLHPGRMVTNLEGHGGQVYSARFVRNDREILTAGTDGTPGCGTRPPGSCCGRTSLRPR